MVPGACGHYNFIGCSRRETTNSMCQMSSSKFSRTVNGVDRRAGSFAVAAAVLLIFALAIHSSRQPQHMQAQTTNNYYETMPEVPVQINATRRNLRSMNFIDRRNPNDLQRLHNKAGTYIDPQTTKSRLPNPLTADDYKIDPLVKPDGYPWHRWANTMQQQPDSYPLNTKKYVNILARLGNGENRLGDVSPQNYTQNGVPIDENTVRMHGMVRPYIIRGGTVLRPEGRTGMFVTLVERAVELADTMKEQDKRMKALVEGELPMIFDANDYAWCGDDLVPIFRLNAIRSRKCMHSWPVMSLTYFNDPTNFQLAESPYQWDGLMTEWDETYPWEKKIDKVVWRGRITGYTYKDGERPRQKLVQYAREYLDVMDIKPSTAKSKMPQDDFQKYKAILDIDGNAWSARLGKLLCYNSVVIKVESSYVGYWEKEIKPWVHYIPAEDDFSDLEKTVRYVMDPENAEQIKQVIKNGQAFCRTKLTMEQYTVDMLWTLLAYRELIAGSPDFLDEWKSNEAAYSMPALDMKPWKSRAQAQAEAQAETQAQA